MRINKKTSKSRMGSFVLEATIVTPIIIVLLAAMLSSMTAVNTELYVQRATENVIQEINLAIPIATSGFSCLDDISKAIGIGDAVDANTDEIDSFLSYLGSASGATGIDIEDVIATTAFGRLVRDRIVNEYHKICQENWVFTDLLQNMAVYLDYDKDAKSVFVGVYYDLGAGSVSIFRKYYTAISLYSDPITRSGSEKDPDKETESIWDKDNFERGIALRKKYGGNLPHNYPVISRFENREAASIKSIDTTSPYYQNIKTLEKTVKGYIDDLASFEGAKWGDTVITPQDIHSRRLIIVLPENGSADCLAAIESLRAYAQSQGVILQIEQYGESHRYSQDDENVEKGEE